MVSRILFDDVPEIEVIRQKARGCIVFMELACFGLATWIAAVWSESFISLLLFAG